MASHWGAPSLEAFGRAEGAYGSVVRRSLASAHAHFAGDVALQRRSCEGMGISDTGRLKHGLAIIENISRATVL